MVTQTGWCYGSGSIGRIFLKLCLSGIAGTIVFTQAVKCFGLKQEEPCTYRTIAIFKTGRGETIFHHGKLGSHLHAHIVGRTCIPHRIPCTALTFTNAAWLINVNRTTACNHRGFTFDNVYFVFTDGKTDSACNLVFSICIKEKLNNKTAL